MIKEVKVFEVDGKRYDTYEQAVEAERQGNIAKEAIELLGGYYDDIEFANGDGVIVIKPIDYNGAMEIYNRLMEERYGDSAAFPRRLDDDNMAPPPMKLLMYILRCTMRKNENEYWRVGQPFFKANLDKMTSQKRINDEK